MIFAISSTSRRPDMSAKLITTNDPTTDLFIAQVRKIDDGLADICQRHLDEGYSLSTVMAMLKDAQRVAAAARGSTK